MYYGGKRATKCFKNVGIIKIHTRARTHTHTHTPTPTPGH
uniref:Uncharacterized protein n=1 Tax=Anguilla anguilla TaxID=7936 RepID=A0A0E9X7N6_ANGAN